jgi:glycosyltransferase A (GT-A) superfamily protein (DUF2064 family)
MADHNFPARLAALALFCRKPSLGAGKRRLAGFLGDVRTLAVASALLECALEDAAVWPDQLIISPAAASDAHWAGRLTLRPAWVVPQPEGNLGERIAAVDAVARARGCDRVLFIGSDAPAMRLEDLTAARTALDHSDVVLIPAADGGVTLMGARVAWPDLTDLPWSEAALGAALDRRCLQSGRTVTRLPGSYDVDTPADLARTVDQLAQDHRPARRRLHALLRELAPSGPDPQDPARAGMPR